jgi:chromosome segregation ATPase
MSGSEQEMYSEILAEMKKISENVISTEYLKSELEHLKSNTDSKVIDLKEDISELKIEFKEIRTDFNNMDKNLIEFKNEMAPIIDFKKQVQAQIIRYSAIAFTALLAMSIGLGQV